MQRNSYKLSRVKASLKQAYYEKNRAENFMKIWDWNGSVKASQCSIKHSVESLFWLVGEKFDFNNFTAKLNSVIEELLELYKFGLYYQDKLKRIRWIVNVWINIREELIYAYEEDAEFLKNYANEAYHICNYISSLVKSYVNRMKFKSYPGDDGFP